MKRWYCYRKAEVVEQLLAGGCSIDELCAEHGVSREELEDWTSIYQRYGARGLVNKRMQTLKGRRVKHGPRGGSQPLSPDEAAYRLRNALARKAVAR